MTQALWMALLVSITTLISVSYGADRPIADVLAALRNPETGSLDFQAVEKEFDKAEDAGLRLSLARMLMSAPTGVLLRPPYFYARYLAPNSELVRVKRLAADGAFEEADLGAAKDLYLSIIQDPQTTDEDREYAVFKLGWVYLNLGRPEDAFALWLQRLTQNTKGDLRESLEQDAGRAFGEAVARSRPISIPPGLWADLVVTGTFLEGVSLGVKRVSSINRERLREQLAGTPFYSVLLMRWMKEQNGIVPSGCDSIPWLERARGQVDAEVTKKHLSRCVRDMDARKAPRFFWTPRMMPIYMSLSLTGLDRWPRARALEITGSSQKACVEYAGAFRDVLGQPISPHSEDVIKDLFFSVANTCKSSSQIFQAVRDEVLVSDWLRAKSRSSEQVLEFISLDLARLQSMEQLKEKWEVIGSVLERESDFRAYQQALEAEGALKEVTFSGIPEDELEPVLSAKLMGLKKSIQTSARYKWKFPGFLKAADQSLVRAVESLALGLDRLSEEKPELRETLAELSKEIRRWRIQ